MFMKDLGVDGCELSAQPGGHVSPANATDLQRSVEAINGAGIDLVAIATATTSLADPTIRNVAGIANAMEIPIFKVGRWKYTPGTEVEARLLEVQRDLAGLASLARAANVSMAMQNLTGDYVGSAIWDINAMIRGLDPRLVGYDFDIGYAVAQGCAGGWLLALRMAMARLKMVTVRDFLWTKDGNAWKMTPCPLGEGMVDWPAFFSTLAAARFTGPVSIDRDYQPKDEIAALKHDIDFVRKQIATAYGVPAQFRLNG